MKNFNKDNNKSNITYKYTNNDKQNSICQNILIYFVMKIM